MDHYSFYDIPPVSSSDTTGTPQNPDPHPHIIPPGIEYMAGPTNEERAESLSDTPVMMYTAGGETNSSSDEHLSEDTTNQSEVSATETQHTAGAEVGHVALYSENVAQTKDTTTEYSQFTDDPEVGPENSAQHKVTYNKVGARIVDQITRLEAELPKVRHEADQQAAEFQARYGGPPPQGMFDGQANIMESRIKELDAELEQLRPPTDADIAYRRHVKRELPKAIGANTPDELPLRFHGTSLVRTQGVLTTKELSSSVDRHGAATSYDAAGAISVTSADAVGLSIREYLDLNKNDYCSPPGCLIAVLPASAEDVTDGLIMRSAYFEENPRVLFGVAVSQENLAEVRQWATDAGIDPGKVREYFDFAEHLARLKTQLEQGQINLRDILPPGWKV